jgi:hypothetical protein
MAVEIAIIMAIGGMEPCSRTKSFTIRGLLAPFVSVFPLSEVDGKMARRSIYTLRKYMCSTRL